MPRVRSIGADGLDRFVEAGGLPQHHEEVRQYVESMFRAGSMRPEWCFVLEDEGQLLLGRVALWTLPGMEYPLDLVLLDLRWRQDYLESGAFLLRRVLEEAQGLGADEVGHILDAPPMWPQWQYYPKERAGMLVRAGFIVERETIRFEWRSGNAPPSVPERLVFRSLEEVGKAAFVDAVVRVSEDTLDREIWNEREERGPEKAGREFFEMESKLEHDPSWWRLAYTPEGDLVGLIMASKNPTSPVIGYIGVVPEHRGRGYADDLLARGTDILRSAGAEQVRADTDIHNAPMALAFRRAGYTEFATRREYGVDLPSNEGRPVTGSA
ncbi:MAG: GNAT family N-acetyltransferase [Actinomycetota bacterium]|nr:GNAT family N-acetyltransferase [Actinomycetota bacterium]